jgi:hypothetical protein
MRKVLLVGEGIRMDTWAEDARAPSESYDTYIPRKVLFRRVQIDPTWMNNFVASRVREAMQLERERLQREVLVNLTPEHVAQVAAILLAGESVQRLSPPMDELTRRALNFEPPFEGPK